MKTYGVNTGFKVVQMTADEVLDLIDKCLESGECHVEALDETDKWGADFIVNLW